MHLHFQLTRESSTKLTMSSIGLLLPQTERPRAPIGSFCIIPRVVFNRRLLVLGSGFLIPMWCKRKTLNQHWASFFSQLPNCPFKVCVWRCPQTFGCCPFHTLGLICTFWALGVDHRSKMWVTWSQSVSGHHPQKRWIRSRVDKGKRRRRRKRRSRQCWWSTLNPKPKP